MCIRDRGGAPPSTAPRTAAATRAARSTGAARAPLGSAIPRSRKGRKETRPCERLSRNRWWGYFFGRGRTRTRSRRAE
eukprot:2912813-Pyramimonas_sp.AAC.1